MRSFFLLWCLWLFPSLAHAQVVVSIKPLHSLVANLVEGTDIPITLLVDGKTSLHDYVLRPSQAKALREAKAVFFISDDFEQFLAKTLTTLPANVKRVPMVDIKGMTLYPVRVDGGFDAHEHHDDAHKDDNRDLHVWLSVANARMMASHIAHELISLYPTHKATITANQTKLETALAKLDKDVKPRMAKLSGKAFVVFHDAYQYFDRAYGLHHIGSITLHPEQGLSAKRVSELRKKIIASHAQCVFREPQFDAKIVDSLMQGTKARSAVLDPEGALLTPGASLYVDLMKGLAAGLEQCLL